MNLEPPPDDLRLFYDAEDAAPVLIDVEAQARVLERVRSVAEVAAPAAAAAAFSVGTKASLVIATVTFLAGAAVGNLVTRSMESDATVGVVSSEPEVAPAEPPLAMPSEASPDAPPDATSEVPETEPEFTAEPTEPHVAQAAPAARDRAGNQDLPRERRLLDSVAAAIARERWRDAERALLRHQRAFPRGELVEEREALRVRVVFERGRFNMTERLATQFLARFSTSLYAPRVRTLQRRAREQSHEETPAE